MKRRLKNNEVLIDLENGDLEAGRYMGADDYVTLIGFLMAYLKYKFDKDIYYITTKMFYFCEAFFTKEENEEFIKMFASYYKDKYDL